MTLMRIVQASKINKRKLSVFLKENEGVNDTLLSDYGYVVLSNQHIIGCFQLSPIEKEIFWLNQLYVTRNKAGKLPVLLQLIIMLVESQEVKALYAHSEQPITDLLLQSVSFSQHIAHEELLSRIVKHKGQWWSYYVS